MSSSVTPPPRPALGRDHDLGRIVLGSSGVIALGGVAARLMPLLTAPILTRLLGPSPYAVAALFGTVISLGTVLALGGIDMAYARYYFGGIDADRSEVERLCWRYSIVASLAAAALIGVAWATVLSDKFDIDSGLWSLAAAAIVLGVANTMAMTRLRMRGRYRRVAAARVALGAATALSSVLFAVLWRRDAWALVAGAICGIGVSVAVQGVPPLRELMSRAKLSRQTAWKAISLGLPSMVTALTYWVMVSSDRWMLSFFSGNEVLGVYTFAAAIGSLGLLLNAAITLVWFPEIAKVFEEQGSGSAREFGRLWSGLVLLLALVWLFVSAFGVDALRLLSASEFHPGSSFVPWIAGFIFFRGVSSLANTGHWLHQDLRPAAVWSILGVALLVALDLALIPRWGAMAAAIVACSSAAVVAVGIMWSAERRVSVAPPWRALGPVLLLVFLAGILLSREWGGHPLLSATAKVPVFCILSYGFVRAVMPDWASTGVDWVRNFGKR
jgi:O-antigen/teichoic acid export membrane protein